MRRLGAVGAAVAMVLLSLYARSQWIEGGKRTGTSTNAVRLVCASELEAACTGLAGRNRDVTVTVEPAGTTAARLAGSRSPAFDAWLAPSPWAQMVDVTRTANGLDPAFGAPSSPIARSPLVLVVRKDRAAVVAPSCGGPPWKCLGDAAGAAQAKPGLADPSTSAIGLLVLSQATSEYLGNADYSRADLQDNDQYLDWLTRLGQSIPRLGPSGASPFAEMLQQLPTATFDAVGTTEAEAGPAIAAAAPDRRNALTLIYPEPVVTADVVLAPLRGRHVGNLAGSDDLLSALAAAGWRVPAKSPVRGVSDKPALPARNGIPRDPGALVALQETWRGVPR